MTFKGHGARLTKKIHFCFWGWDWKRWTIGISIGDAVGNFGIDLWMGPCSLNIIFGELPWENEED